MDLGLAGRTALITGGSRGIGAETARAYAAEGATVALTYNSDAEAAEAVVKQIEAAGGEAFAVRLDLTDGAAAKDTVLTAIDRLGRLDALVNNAVWWSPTGIFQGNLEDYPAAEWTQSLRANLEGHFWVTQAAAAALRAGGAGRIVTVSSDRAERGAVGAWAYGAAKTGLHGFTRSLAWDLGRDGVLANVVLPAVTTVDGGHRFVPEGALAALAAEKPTRRLPTTQDVARAVVFLGSPANGCTTGEVLHVTGGVV